MCDAAFVAAVLEEVGGDLHSAIEYILALQNGVPDPHQDEDDSQESQSDEEEEDEEAQVDGVELQYFWNGEPDVVTIPERSTVGQVSTHNSP